MGCSFVAIMVSRGSSMLIEGIEELKTMPSRWENIICVVSGVVAGTLLGSGAFMWKESVVINRISVFGVPWMIAMLALMMRWMYAPHQRRYLFLAMLVYGWCVTIHQSLLLSSPAVEILIALISYKLGRDLLLTNCALYFIILYFMAQGTVPALNAMTFTEKTIFNLVGIASIMGAGWLWTKTGKILTEWKTIIMMATMWAIGVLVYLYEPISGMTDPPMQWGYPRTVEGFFHALSRGQYGVGEGTNVFSDPTRFAWQLWYVAHGLSESFSWVYLFIGTLPLFFLKKMQQRERAWIIGVTGIYMSLGVLLVIVLNVTPDRASADLCKVFFTASHGVFAMLIGYGMTLLAAYIATHYEKIRRWCFVGGVIALLVAIYCLVDAAGKLFYGPAGEISLSQLPHHIAMAFNKDQYGLPIFSGLILVALPIIFLLALLVYRKRGPVLILLALFAITPICSGISHWYKCEQRNHWFGYWFGHDMFTPPFTDPKTGKLSYDNTLRAELLKNPANTKTIYPEMARDTILFGGTDPGRFCPTYIIFCESFIPHRCQPEQDQKFDRRDVYIITQNALADGTYLDYLRAQYNRSKQIDPPFFSELSKYIFGIAFGPANADSGIFSAINKTLYYTLDVPFTKWGAHVEAYRRAAGVYPPKEIYIPTPDDSQKCFQDYTDDVARRAQLNQLAPGEDVQMVRGADGRDRAQVSGQVAVMKINGLLCKVIFDNCPSNEFYVEESFPLDWMYPYETPFGVIMKINRNTLPELTQDVFNLDHKFWNDFTPRLCGNWITYDTSVKEICDFAERTYISNNYKGYTGDRAFVRDDDAQKAFSKLRSSQAGMYAWRLSPQCPPEFRQKTAASQAALIRETDYAFKQAFAFCPFSPEAVFRYINFLLPLGRFDDAILIAQTCKKLDPYNEQVTGLIKNLQDYKKQNEERSKAISQIDQLENAVRTNPNDVRALITLGVTYAGMQQTNRAVELFDQALVSSNLTYPDAGAIAGYYSQMNNLPKLTKALEKLAALAPDQPEPHYDLAALEAYLGQTAPALTNLKIALDLSAARLKTNPAARDLLAQARTDGHLNSLRALPEFVKLVPPQ